MDEGMAAEIETTEKYHQWYYDTEVWQGVEFLGVPCYKSVSDMWNYQEIMAILKPSLVIEFGTRFGGSALYFSVIGRSINPDLEVLSVDISHQEVLPQVHADPAVHLATESSVSPEIKAKIIAMRARCPGKVFFILDSDHRKAHVLAEMELLRSVVESGDYLIVEDGNINGNPVLPGWGEGPFEAIQEYMQRYPDDYQRDIARETKFGFTFAPSGFLIKT
jgi:cephalosporin hydroxylase